MPVQDKPTEEMKPGMNGAVSMETAPFWTAILQP
jgi:hypothetical protein